VWQGSLPVSQGQGLMALPVAQWARGTYVLNLRQGAQQMSRRLLLR
jgi:hypothetical protein